jgi:hypothetical protein
VLAGHAGSSRGVTRILATVTSCRSIVVACSKTGYPETPAVLFDLDGTLIDSVYQHVLAWRKALGGCGIKLAAGVFTAGSE